MALGLASLIPRMPGSGLPGDVQAELAMSIVFIPKRKKKWSQSVISDLVRSQENSTGKRLKSQVLTSDLANL